MPSLFLLSLGYFLSYVGTGLAVKLFTGKTAEGFFGLSSMEYLVYSTGFSSVFCVAVAVALGWHRRGSLSRAELGALFVSGACTAYIVPATTLIYSLPVSVMISMVLMRGSVIVASRLVDFLLARQGLTHKRIPWQEEVAVLFAIGAVVTKLVLSAGTDSRFPLTGAVALFFYFFAYLVRLFIMNRAKLTGIAGRALDQRLYFGVEQMVASGVLFTVAGVVFVLHRSAGAGGAADAFVNAVREPNAYWMAAAASGLPYSFVAFLSVFLFLYPGKSATFTGVLNRLISLMGGTASTLAIAGVFGGGFPPREDWFALALICAAIGFLAWGDHAARARAALSPKA